MKKIGIEPGKSFDFSKLDAAVQKALASAPEEAQALMKWKVPTLARVVDYWSRTPTQWVCMATTISSAP